MTLKKVENQIATGEASLLYFSGKHCSVCRSLRPKMEQALGQHLPKLRFLNIDTALHPEISANYSVFHVPTMLFFIDGKEFIRKGGAVSIPLFIEEIKRIYDLYYDA